MIVSGSMPIESNLGAHLVELLNSEIVLETIANAKDAMNWLRTTFFYARAFWRNNQVHDLGEAAPTDVEKCLRSK